MEGQYAGPQHTPELLRAFADEMQQAADVLEQFTAAQQ